MPISVASCPSARFIPRHILRPCVSKRIKNGHERVRVFEESALAHSRSTSTYKLYKLRPSCSEQIPRRTGSKKVLDKSPLRLTKAGLADSASLRALCLFRLDRLVSSEGPLSSICPVASPRGSSWPSCLRRAASSRWVSELKASIRTAASNGSSSSEVGISEDDAESTCLSCSMGLVRLEDGAPG